MKLNLIGTWIVFLFLLPAYASLASHNDDSTSKFLLQTTSPAHLLPIIDQLRAQKMIKLPDSPSRIAFAERIFQSGLPFESIEKRIVRFLKEGDIPFVALENAIERELGFRWRKTQIDRLKAHPDRVAAQIGALELSAHDQEKAQRIYAVCINPFRDERIRSQRFTPKLCDPVAAFDHPRHESSTVSLRTKPSHQSNAEIEAYHVLIAAGQQVAREHQLNDGEKIMMAKCMAENALKFLPPAQYPFTAIYESARLSTRSPEAAFFQEKGICSNFAGITYNLAQALEIKSPLFLARRQFHVFLEAQLEGQWFHVHPFNSTRKSCDFIRFSL